MSSEDHFEVAETPAVALPFEKKKQAAVLGHLIENDKFFLQAIGKIKPEWFADTYAQRILKEKVKFYEEMGRCPTVNELKSVHEFQIEEQRVIIRLHDFINLSIAYAKEYGLDALSKELTDWLHSQIYQNAVRNSARLYNNKKPKKAYEIVSQAMLEIKQSTFEDEKEEFFENYLSEFEKNQQEYSSALTIGLGVFDRLLTPKAKTGSLLPGDTSVILAPTNVGKTTSMITIIKHNLWMGKSVLFITHEGRPSDIKEKLWCAMLECTPKELYEMYSTVEGRTRIEVALLWMKNFITYLPLNKAGLTVEEVESTIRRRCDDRKVRNNGKGYDLLVNDYPAKLTTEMAKGGNFSKRNIDEQVYGTFVQLGLEYNMHVICAIQTNREGSKVNKGQKENRVLTMEDVQESWGPMTAATNVWTINRSPEDKIKNRLLYHIDKSRSSEVGFIVVCRTDYPRATTHGDKLGATYYRGSSSHGDKLDEYMRQFPNTEIPGHVLSAV